MATAVLKPGTGKELKRLVAMLANSVAETLGSLIARELLVKPAEVEVCDAETILGALQRPHAVVRGALDKDYAGKILFTLFEVQDACAMAGMLMMTPDEVVEQRRAKNALEGEDLEAFSELGNVLCSGLGNVLREAVANIDIRLQDHGVIKPGLDTNSLLPEGPLVLCKLKLKVASYPETIGGFLVDLATGEKWNKGPIETGDAAPEAPAIDKTPPPPAPSKPDEDSLDDIPAAPIRGVLNSYLALPDAWRVLRRACRRVGLELRRHGRAQIPNPAAHKNEFVVLDVPPGEERRFDWCRRIKEFSPTTKVVLLLHRPSRARVTQAFLSQADAILGLPIEEAPLSQKLTTLLG